jgi:hypothetical protein
VDIVGPVGVEVGPVVLDVGRLVVEVGSVVVEVGSAVVAVVLGSAALASGAPWSWTAMRSAAAGPIQARRRGGFDISASPG